MLDKIAIVYYLLGSYLKISGESANNPLKKRCALIVVTHILPSSVAKCSVSRHYHLYYDVGTYKCVYRDILVLLLQKTPRCGYYACIF